MTIKQYGGVFGRNPTFNNVTIEGTLTFDGDIDINSDLTIEDNLYVLGNVGIGTSSPSAPLDIVSSATGGTTLELDNTSTGGRNYTLYSSGSGNSFGAGNFALYDADAAAVRLLVNSSGSVGIGTSSPTMPLSVKAASNAFAISMHGRSDGYSELYGASNDGSTKYAFLQTHSAQTKLYTLVNTPLLFGTNSAERMRIDSSGQTQVVGYDAMTLGFPAVAGGASRSGIKPTVTGAGAGQLQFLVGGDNTTEATTIAAMLDASGNLLVGKTSPALATAGIELRADNTAYFTKDSSTPVLINRVTNDGDIVQFRKDNVPVGGIGSESGSMYIEGNPAAGKSGLTFFGSYIEPRDDGSPADNAIDLGSSDNRFKDLYLSGVSYNGDGSAAAPSISFGADTNTGFYRVGSDQIGFATAGTIKAKLDANGNWFVGGTSVGDSDSCAIESYGAITIARASGVGRIHMTFTNGGATVGTISTTGSATAYNTSSDQRLKENIADADDAGSKIDTIQVRKFDWKADGSHQDYGMVAQELLEVAPEAVSAPEDSEEMMGVDYSKLVPMMLKEIQSLRARVAQLES